MNGRSFLTREFAAQLLLNLMLLTLVCACYSLPELAGWRYAAAGAWEAIRP